MFKSLLKSTNNTRVVVEGLWRSDALLKLSKSDIAILKNNNIKRIIDLRGHRIAAAYPCSILSDNYFDYHNVPIDFTDESSTELDWFYIYRGILHHYNFEKVLRLIGESDDGVLVNCTAGKDRTGTTAMVVEYILGFSREKIIADYLLSIEYLKDWFVEWERKYGLKVEDNMPKREFAELILDDPILDVIKKSEIGQNILRKYICG